MKKSEDQQFDIVGYKNESTHSFSNNRIDLISLAHLKAREMEVFCLFKVLFSLTTATFWLVSAPPHSK